MQRWHLTKAVDRQLIEVKQTNEQTDTHTIARCLDQSRRRAAHTHRSLCGCQTPMQDGCRHSVRVGVVVGVVVKYTWTRSLNAGMTLTAIKKQITNSDFCHVTSKKEQETHTQRTRHKTHCSIECSILL